MSAASRVLWVNPRITTPAHARFPLSLLSLAAHLAPRYESHILDGNLDPATPESVSAAVRELAPLAVGVSVMGGPQLAPAIALSRVLRAQHPEIPILWGGYFPSLFPASTMSADYVDYAIRGSGETVLDELLPRLERGDTAALHDVPGLSWRCAGEVAHNHERPFTPAFPAGRLPYELLGDPRRYLVPSFLGRRTAAHQAAQGCRFRCTFCGVASVFRGGTALPPPQRLESALAALRQLGADSLQLYDHNFFDREAETTPLLEVLARFGLPWWCYARADALLSLSARSWQLVERSRLRMAYIGAETADATLLRQLRKGTHPEQTLEVARLCRAHGVIPELSFMLASPEDPEGGTERTFEFIRHVKRANPDAEIVVYIYTPTPAEACGGHRESQARGLHDAHGARIDWPYSPEGWSQPQWVDYACHRDAPWLTPRLRRRIADFVTVLRCRFPTVQDTRTAPWGRSLLRTLAGWRYRLRCYHRPHELSWSQSLLRLADPRQTSL